MLCPPPWRYSPRVCRNVEGWFPNHRLSGGYGHFFSGGRGPYLEPRRPTRGVSRVPIIVQPAHLIENIDEGQSIVALERHRGIHAFLRPQHPSERVWELPGSNVDGHELCEERVLECWSVWWSVSAEKSSSAGKDLTHDSWMSSLDR